MESCSCFFFFFPEVRNSFASSASVQISRGQKITWARLQAVNFVAVIWRNRTRLQPHVGQILTCGCHSGQADNLTSLWFFSFISYFGASSVEIWCFQPESNDIFTPFKTHFDLRDEDLMLNVQTNKLKSRYGEDFLRRA